MNMHCLELRLTLCWWHVLELIWVGGCGLPFYHNLFHCLGRCRKLVVGIRWPPDDRYILKCIFGWYFLNGYWCPLNGFKLWQIIGVNVHIKIGDWYDARGLNAIRNSSSSSMCLWECSRPIDPWIIFVIFGEIWPLKGMITHFEYPMVNVLLF